MKKLLAIAGALAGLFVLVTVAGAGMNAQHVAQSRASSRRRPARWAADTRGCAVVKTP